VLADVGLTEQDVARRIVEWAARVADRAAADEPQTEGAEGQ
jgi:1-deoxy-D-xylulose-5-phosphate synthase